MKNHLNLLESKAYEMNDTLTKSLYMWAFCWEKNVITEAFQNSKTSPEDILNKIECLQKEGASRQKAFIRTLLDMNQSDKKLMFRRFLASPTCVFNSDKNRCNGSSEFGEFTPEVMNKIYSWIYNCNQEEFELSIKDCYQSNDEFIEHYKKHEKENNCTISGFLETFLILGRNAQIQLTRHIMSK
jgi:hypothetical protein